MTARRKMLEGVFEAMDARITHFWGVASGDWLVAYVVEGEQIPEGDANNLASSSSPRQQAQSMSFV